MEFVAIDFETANGYRNSACSIGLVRSVDGKLVEEYHTLIRPPVLRFWSTYIDIHGITPNDVRAFGTFDTYWEKIRDFIGDSTLVAHNAAFDRGVLSACLQHFDLPPVGNPWQCSFQTARRFFRNQGICLPNYRLNTVADYFDVHFQHHDALEDARTCAIIMQKMGDLNVQ
ncbi:MAG: 3'-5' exonuclease [Planctomycetia bacterium]|nr:3'-5' exonuclease [Planctomycetia bacterium]